MAKRDVESRSKPGVRGVVVSGPDRRWPNATVLYVLEEGFSDRQRVTDAIKHWEEKTKIKFMERTSEKNYVLFRKGAGCSASVGMVGGRQEITLSEKCSTGNVIHEIGHTVGLFHEQSREDRDAYIKVELQNVKTGKESQFAKHIDDGEDVGKYDFGSIMHYPAAAFAKDLKKPTITTIPPGEKIGQRDGLSPADIATINKLYP